MAVHPLEPVISKAWRGAGGRLGSSVLAGAVLLGLSACSTAPQQAADPGEAGASSRQTLGRLSAQEAADVTVYAIGLVGTPYRFGGNTPEGGFDCSGLIGHVYQSRAGLLAPRTVAQLQYWGQGVTVQQLRAGDLVLFGTTDAPTHAGIYVGEGRFVHAPSTGGEVRLASLRSAHWARQRQTYRRP